MKRLLYLALVVPALLLGVSSCNDEDEPVAVWVPNRVEVPVWATGADWTDNAEELALYNSLVAGTANMSVKNIGELVCDDLGGDRQLPDVLGANPYPRYQAGLENKRWYYHSKSGNTFYFVNGGYYAPDFNAQIIVGFARSFALKANFDKVLKQYKEDTSFDENTLLIVSTTPSWTAEIEEVTVKAYDGLPIIGFDQLTAPHHDVDVYTMALLGESAYPVYALETIDPADYTYFPDIYAAIVHMIDAFIAEYGNEVEIGGSKIDLAGMKATYTASLQ